jgi:hypothetical protein
VDLLVGLFFFALIFIPIGLIVWGCIRAYRGRNIWLEGSAELPWTPQESFGHVAAKMAPSLQRLRYRLTNQTLNAVVFSKTYRPAWLAIPCVLFFPLGLLSLLYSKTVDITFSLQSQAGGTHVSYSGHGPPRLSEELPTILVEPARGPAPREASLPP